MARRYIEPALANKSANFFDLHDSDMADAEVRTPTGSDDEDVVDSKYWNAEISGKRARKEVTRIESAASPQHKRKSISVNAAGTRLGDIKVIADRIQGTTVHKGNDDENPLKELHHVIFARAGKWNEVPPHTASAPADPNL